MKKRDAYEAVAGLIMIALFIFALAILRHIECQIQITDSNNVETRR